MRIAFFKSTCAKNGVKIMEAFAEGVEASGDEVIWMENITDGHFDAAVIWSMLWSNPNRKRIYNYCISRKIPLFILEVGCLNRNKSWKIGLNHLDNRSEFNFHKLDEKRHLKFGLSLKPYTFSGNSIMICGQNENSALWDGMNVYDWINNLVAEFKKYTNRPVIFRPHPRSTVHANLINCPVNMPKFLGNYDDYDFLKIVDKVALIVNYNSSPAIEAVINGIPVLTGPTSIASMFSIEKPSNISNLQMYERDYWFKCILHTEWFEDEIQQGLPYRRLKEVMYEGN